MSRVPLPSGFACHCACLPAKRKGQAMVKPGPEHSPDRAWEGGGRGLDDVGPAFKSPHLKKTFPILKKQQPRSDKERARAAAV